MSNLTVPDKLKKINLPYIDFDSVDYDVHKDHYLLHKLAKPFKLNSGEYALSSILDKWAAPYRYYHSFTHLKELLLLIDYISDQINDDEFIDDLKLLAYFHDVIYIPWNNDNAEKSAEYFFESILGNNCNYKKELVNHPNKERIYRIADAINATHTHVDVSDLSYVFNKLDMYVLSHYPSHKLIEYEHKIFKEFQFINYKKYCDVRCEILQSFNLLYKRKEIDGLIEYVKNRKIKVGIYTGSFNPFHVGHLDIKNKAEQVFDKVVIARGKNYDKDVGGPYKNDLMAMFPFNEIATFTGYAYDFASQYRKESNADVFLIKGMRNAKDFELEQLQSVFTDEIARQKHDKKIQTVSFFSEQSLQHISSSAIRMMNKVEPGTGSVFSIKEFDENEPKPTPFPFYFFR